MDVVNPELVWLEGRCYRLNVPRSDSSIDLLPPETMNQGYAEYDDEDEDDLDLELTTTANGRLQASLQIPMDYFGYIIGKAGSTKKKIAMETQTDIKFPPRNKRGDIIVTGASRKNVYNAVKRIDNIVKSARKKQRPTHFLSIPLVVPEITEKFAEFKKIILDWGSIDGVDESIFVDSASLHLTLYVIPILDEFEMQTVLKILEELKPIVFETIGKNKHVPLKVSNVAYMNDDPKSIHVLYADATEKNEDQKGLILELMDKILNYFSKKGFECSNPATKVHMTLMNTRKRVTSQSSQRIPFDGTKILEHFKDFHFGDAVFKEIQLSSMSEDGDDGYYKCEHLIEL